MREWRLERVYKAIEKAKEARDASPIRFYRPNTPGGGQDRMHRSPARERLTLAGNSSGKSYGAAAEVAYHVEEEIDDEGNGTGRACHPYRNIKVPSIGWVSSTTEELQKEPRGGTQSYINGFLSRKIAHVNQKGGVWSDITLSNRSRIVFKTMQSGRDAYQSASVDWVWIDEPHPQTIIHEIRMRLIRRRPAGSLWWSFTPVVDPQKRVSVEMVRWVIRDMVRPILAAKNAGSHNPSKSDVFFMESRENARYIDYNAMEEALSTMSKEEQIVRRTGRYIEMAIGQGFNTEQLDICEDACREPLEEGEISWSDSEQRYAISPHAYNSELRSGFITRFWRFPAPGRRYVIGGDVGGTNDPTSISVVDVGTKELVAELHGWIDEIELAVQVMRLGIYYNMAEIGIEVNKEGKTTVALLQRGSSDLGIIAYPNLYRRSKASDLAKGWDVRSYDIGWHTNAQTRDILIGGLRKYLLHASRHEGILPSFFHLDEMRHFVQNKSGKYEAEGGYFDDRVMSLGIALQIVRRYDVDMFDAPQREEDALPFMSGSGGLNMSHITINPSALESDALHQRRNPYWTA